MQDFDLVLSKQRRFFSSGQTKDIIFRKTALRRMLKWIKTHERDLLRALKVDLNKAPFEAYATEIGIVSDEIKYALKHLEKWSKDQKVPSPIKQFPSKSFIHREPFGVILIISPWNYPFQLTIAPLVAAVSAGNCAMVRPSSDAPETSKVIAAMIHNVFRKEHVTTILGGRQENEILLQKRFDHICFTGSAAIGKVVMAAASRHLTPVTLELGGKSPCIVDKTANIKLAAKRITWGKFLNAGQTCVAPDYVLVHESVKQALVREIKKYIQTFYGNQPCLCQEYPKIINKNHFLRLQGLMQDGNILSGGSFDSKTLRIEPTLIDHLSWNSPIMQAEIFGPLLPILEFKTLDEVIRQVNARPKPLALYLFTQRHKNEKAILQNISFGGGCINDTVVHLATTHMPFGGVGESGIGSYHGKYGFEIFSHKKSILKKSLLIDIPLRYPPFKNHLALLKRL